MCDHLLHVASVVQCVGGTLYLNIQPSTGISGAKMSCVSGPTASEAAQSLLYTANTTYGNMYEVPLKSLVQPREEEEGRED